MNCQETKILISAYLDNELEPVDRQRVADHLQACAGCQAEAQAIQKSWELLGQIKAIEPDPHYQARFWQSVDARMPWHAKMLQAVQTLLWQRRWVPAMAAAAIVMLFSLFGITQYFQKPDLPAALTALNDIELEMVANMDLVEDYEIIQDMDFFSDFDIIEELNEHQTS